MFTRLWRRAPANGDPRDHEEKEHLILLRNVVKTFDTAAGPFTALKNVDLRVNAGEFVAVIGKSGSGKSTLSNMITGIDRPTSGEVWVGGTAVHKLNEGQMAVWRGRNLGIVFQFFQLLPTLTLLENIMLPMDFNHMYSGGERRKRAMQLLDQMSMAEHANKLPSAISGGQQQRVAIARALANDPPILIADEPTGNLDSKTANAVFDLFDELVREGKTIVMVTHDNDLAKRVSRSVIIADGQVIEEYLAKTFPALTEEQLVASTHHIEPIRYPPGAIILQEGQPVDRFHIIAQGRVEVVIRHPSGQEIVVACYERGSYFGEVELMRGGQSIATIRAASDTEVEVATLDRATFESLMAQSAATQAALGRVAKERAEENVSIRNAPDPSILPGCDVENEVPKEEAHA